MNLGLELEFLGRSHGIFESGVDDFLIQAQIEC